jgi:hypothetical protein
VTLQQQVDELRSLDTGSRVLGYLWRYAKMNYYARVVWKLEEQLTPEEDEEYGSIVEEIDAYCHALSPTEKLLVEDFTFLVDQLYRNEIE